MQIDVTNGKRFTEYDALAAVASGEDVLLVRLADGTGVKRIPTVKLSPTGTVILTARSLCWISTIPVWASAMQTRCPLQSRYATIGVLLSCCSHRHHLLNVTLLANLLTLAVKKHSGR